MEPASPIDLRLRGIFWLGTARSVPLRRYFVDQNLPVSSFPLLHSRIDPFINLRSYSDNCYNQNLVSASICGLSLDVLLWSMDGLTQTSGTSSGSQSRAPLNSTFSWFFKKNFEPPASYHERATKVSELRISQMRQLICQALRWLIRD